MGDVLFGGCKGDIRHARKWNAAPTVGVQAAVRTLFSDEAGSVAGRLPVDKDPVLNKMPSLPGNSFVVISNRCHPLGLCAVRDKVDDLRAVLKLARLVRRQKARTGIIC